MTTIVGILLGLALMLGYAPAVGPAVGSEPQQQGVDVIYRHVLQGSDQPLYVKCSTTGKYRAIWRGQWSTDKCGADPGYNVTKIRVPLGYRLKLRAWGCPECRPWTLGPGVYPALRPDRAFWLVKA